MSRACVQQFSISLDGFGTGDGVSREEPFGHAGERLHEWMFTTRWWRERLGQPGGSGGIDDVFVRLHDPGIGAEIMGAGKFGPPGWHEDPEWKGWWGPNPPFHTPVFVLTHHPRPSIEMEGGTTFHFLDASPAEALERAREAADGRDVRIGGGATIIREFLTAGLIDDMHVVVVPILLGRGVRLWDGLEGLEQNYDVEGLGRRGVEEVERRPPGHLDRRPRPMSEHEGRRVERGVRAPPPRPIGVVLPARRAELARAHDLGADARLVLLGDRVVDADGAARASHDPGAEAGGDHPLVQPMAGVAHGGVECLALAGGEAIQ